MTDDVKLPDPVAFMHAMNDAWGRAAPLMQDLLDKYAHDYPDQPLDPFNLRPLYMEWLDKWAQDPEDMLRLQSEYMQGWWNIWQNTALKMLGEEADDVIKPDPKDRRFRDKDWQENAVFDFIKQSYLLTCQMMHKAVEETRGLDDEQKRKLDFYTQLYANALSPSNFALTNPEVLKETLKTGGDNLVRGMENLIEDLERGHGELQISTTDYEAFKLGDNIAATPGKVVYQNDLMQLIQYEPQTDQVHETPLLIIPPWINKYYILDLKPETSFIKWAVTQGHTVFTISWVNPDAKLAQKRFEDYMEEGVLAALDAIEKFTGQKQSNVIGYCLGGTLLTITLAYLESKKKADRVASATFFTTLIDFEKAGDLKIFMDDAQLELLDKQMAHTGVLQGKNLQRTFSLLRANDMIWSFVVNNYLLGKEPFPFDLLYWNDDATNMPAAMHSFYLRKLYRDNLLVKKNGIKMHDTPIDITKIETPCHFISTREDHIAPWRATYIGPQKFAGDKTFTLAASGHTAGIVNHPDKKKYCYWSNSKWPESPDDWFNGAKEHDGSWWPHWNKWISKYTGKMVPARKTAKAIEDAPGSYVKVRG